MNKSARCDKEKKKCRRGRASIVSTENRQTESQIEQEQKIIVVGERQKDGKQESPYPIPQYFIVPHPEYQTRPEYHNTPSPCAAILLTHDPLHLSPQNPICRQYQSNKHKANETGGNRKKKKTRFNAKVYAPSRSEP